MIDVIVNVRDAVFAALVAWTGIGDAEGPKPQKNQPVPAAKSVIEKPIQQHQPQKVY